MSSSLKFCILAAGEADIYAANARAFEWDIAAGHAILDHAGGSIKTHDEKEFFYGKNDYKNLSILAKRSWNLEYFSRTGWIKYFFIPNSFLFLILKNIYITSLLRGFDD